MIISGRREHAAAFEIQLHSRSLSRRSETHSADITSAHAQKTPVDFGRASSLKLQSRDHTVELTAAGGIVDAFAGVSGFTRTQGPCQVSCGLTGRYRSRYASHFDESLPFSRAFTIAGRR